MLPEVEYDSLTITLEPGDRLFLYSDGISECANTEGKIFTEARLLNLIEGTAGLMLDQIIRQLEEQLIKWRGSEEFEDDISLLALEVL